MKTLKKLLAAACSVLICAASMLTGAANASAVMLVSPYGDYYFAEWTEMTEYLNFDPSERAIYQQIDGDRTVVRMVSADGTTGYGPFETDLCNYAITDEQYDMLTAFLTEHYPALALVPNEEGVSWTLVHNGDPTFEEQFAIAKDIKEQTGLIGCASYQTSLYIELKEVDDITASGDATLDGTVDSTDAITALQAYVSTDLLGNPSSLNSAQMLAADVDGDGVISADDALAILSLYVSSMG